MAQQKFKTVYVCTECGYNSPKWNGQCPSCRRWNTMEEEVMAVGGAKNASFADKALMGETAEPQNINVIDTDDEHRYFTGVGELDRVLGGGLVKGSLVLLSGDPGIGKSTLLLQICRYLCEDLKVLYVSGEESVRQIKLRANRLSVDSENLFLVSQTNVETIINTIAKFKPDVVMIDSIQTMCLSSVSSSTGSITQVRECTSAFMKAAKNAEIPIFIVGHVNKDGAIAGPKVLEHIVDTVLYFEGDRNMSYRILRATKNRFGSTNEIGVFEMQSEGLCEVPNPSQMLLSERPTGVPGSCVVCVMEGTRPILAEVQALVSKSGLAAPRRVSTGFDYSKMAMLIAVLEKRVGYFFGNLDAYLNVVGGLRLDEPAADLAVAAALVSSLADRPVDEKALVFGEVGLAGEIRSVMNAEDRIREGARLGFSKCIIPKQNAVKLTSSVDGMEIIGVSNIKEALSHLKN
ncbi:MAG: DNA repair protein RadA [Oscillospiraceae bacterium]|nr:DNA repair protein RadA [Oscillospiraceae bacterium]